MRFNLAHEVTRHFATDFKPEQKKAHEEHTGVSNVLLSSAPTFLTKSLLYFDTFSSCFIQDADTYFVLFLRPLGQGLSSGFIHSAT